MKFRLNEEKHPWLRPAMILVTFTLVLAMILYHFPSIWGFLMQILGLATPFFIGLGIAYMVNPLTAKIEKLLEATIFRKKKLKKTERIIAVLISILLIAALLITILRIIVPQLISSVKSVVTYVSRLLSSDSTALNELLADFNFLGITGSDIVSRIKEVTSALLSNLTPIAANVVGISTDIITSLYHVLIAVITAFYMLMDKERIVARFKRTSYAFINRESSDALIYWCRRANHIFTSFIYGKLLDSLIVGALTFICTSIAGWEYPVLISIVIGVTNIIPFFGPFIGWVPCALILLMINPMHALWFTVFVIILQQLDGNVIGPKILGDYVGVSALSIMIVIVIGSGLFGFVGMLLSVPLYAFCLAVLNTIIETKLGKRDLPKDVEHYLNAPDSLSTEEKK